MTGSDFEGFFKKVAGASRLNPVTRRVSGEGLDDPLLREEHLAHDSRTTNSSVARAQPGPAASAISPSIATAHREVDGDGGRTRADSIDSPTTRTPHHATRFVQTSLGNLSYDELAPHLTERLTRIAWALAIDPMPLSFDAQFILQLHRELCAELTPEIAGRYRQIEVQVGAHLPPLPHLLAELMHNYALDLSAQISVFEGDLERAVDLLSFAEGRFLWIHPFADFNGRVSRLFLGAVLRRLDMPIVDVAFDPGESAQNYFAALQAYDQRNPEPLKRIWYGRFERGV